MQKCQECGELRRRARVRVCRPVVLELSRSARLRRKLRQLIDSSGIPISVFAEWVFGRDSRTLQRWLAGSKIPESVSIWIERLELVELNGGRLILALKWGERRPRWKYFQQQRKRILFQRPIGR